MTETESNYILQTAQSLSAELLSFCRFASLSEEGLREIIERHGLTPNRNLNIGDYSFFLAACNNVRVNERIIKCLLEYFREAADVANIIGTSPLHHLCCNKNATVNIVQLLIDAAPDSVRRENDESRMPLHYLCDNPDMDEKAAIEILNLLLEKCPESIRHADNSYGCLPLHYAARRKTPEFCRVLIEAYPGSERIVNSTGWLPLHYACLGISPTTVEYFYSLYPDAINHQTNVGEYPIHVAIRSSQCRNNPIPAADIVRFLMNCDANVKLQEINGKSLLQYACGLENDDSNMVAIEILKLLLEMCPESIRHTDDKGNLPIHAAAMTRSPEFCRVLIEAYPGSERISTNDGCLPLHAACVTSNLPMVEFLYNLYPDAINTTSNDGVYPIHVAIQGFHSEYKRSPMAGLHVVRFLLDCDPCVKLQRIRGMSVLHVASQFDYNDSTIDEGMQIIMALYDAYPEAIEDDDVARDTQHYHEQVRAFVNSELVHARQARNRRQMTTRFGRLRLHHAVQNNVRPGSVKLLVKGNPSAIRTSDNNGALPLHVACQHHDSPSVIQHLLGIDQTTLQCIDLDGNTALHYACRGAKYGTIALLLERHDAISVSKRNAQQKLPIDLLWESDEIEDEDRESVEYLGSVFLLMKAYPEMLMSIGMQMRQRASAREIGRKRKLGAV